MTTLTKRRSKAAKEIVADPTPPEPTQAELDRAERSRLTDASLSFLHRVFPEGKQWLQVLSGREDATAGSREMQICRYRPEEAQWLILDHRRSGKEAPQTLAEWLASKRMFSEVSFCPSLAQVASDGSPRLPLRLLFSRIPCGTELHQASGGAYRMASLTKLAAARKALHGAPVPPTVLVNSWTSITGFWLLSEAISCDKAAPLLVKMALTLRAEQLSPTSFLTLPGQYCKELLPRREVTVEDASGQTYRPEEFKEWLGEGTPRPRSKEEVLRDVAIRAHRA